MGPKKSSSSTGHARLKACSKCQTLNAPRTFYCKECNHPFYSEEYMNARLKSGVTTPSATAGAVDDQLIMDDEDMIVLSPTEDEMIEFFSNFKAVDFTQFHHDRQTDYSSHVSLLIGDDTDPIDLVIPQYGCQSIQGDNKTIAKKNFIFNTNGHVDSVSLGPLLNDGRQVLAVLVDNSKICLWVTEPVDGMWSYIGTITHGETSVLSIRFCEYLHSDNGSMVLCLCCIDGIEVIVVNPEMGFAQIFSTPKDAQICPSNMDIRMYCGKIELLISSNKNSWVYMMILSSAMMVLERVKIFAFNELIVRGGNPRAAGGLDGTPEDDSRMNQSTCVRFLKHSENFFIAGYSSGSIGLWDIRNTGGPVQVVVNVQGTRRFLVDLATSLLEPKFVFAAYQSGSIVDLMESEISGIAGEVKSSQCFGIDSVGSHVFSGISTGVVVTVDTSLREKLRRPMTSFIAQWESASEHGQDALLVHHDDQMMCIEDRLRTTILSNQSHGKRVFGKIFPVRKLPTNLKNLRANDGACNEGFPRLSGEGGVGASVTCLRAAHGRVAYGTDLGLVHVFSIGD